MDASYVNIPMLKLMELLFDDYRQLSPNLQYYMKAPDETVPQNVNVIIGENKKVNL